MQTCFSSTACSALPARRGSGPPRQHDPCHRGRGQGAHGGTVGTVAGNVMLHQNLIGLHLHLNKPTRSLCTALPVEAAAADGRLHRRHAPSPNKGDNLRRLKARESAAKAARAPPGLVAAFRRTKNRRALAPLIPESDEQTASSACGMLNGRVHIIHSAPRDGRARAGPRRREDEEEEEAKKSANNKKTNACRRNSNTLLAAS